MSLSSLLSAASFLFLSLLLLLLITKKSSSSSSSSSKKIEKSPPPPSPPKLPLIGNLHQLTSLAHRSLYSLSQKHGPTLMLLHLGTTPALVVTSADAVRDIMRTNDQIFSSRPSLKASRFLLYGGLDIAFAPYGHHWRQLRKLFVNHLFGAKTIQLFRRLREEEVAFMIAGISDYTCSETVDMSRILNLFITNTVCRVAFGSRKDVFCELVKEHVDILGQVFIEDCFPWLGWLDVISGLEKRARRCAESWEDVLDQIIEEHEVNKSEPALSENDNCVDILLSLMNDPNMDIAINRQLIKILIKDIIAGGTGTSSSTVEWGMAELIRNEDVRNKLQQEVRAIGSRGASIIKEEDLSKMNYLKCVIKEVLRLHPPGPLSLPRETTESCTIQGYKIPKNVRVLINTWAIGRDPKHFEQPEEFRPERFLDGSVDFRGRDFQLIPFGGGRRICPGMQFAVTTLELAFANLVYWFDWKLPHGMEIEDVDMTESPGIIAQRRQKLNLVAQPAVFVR